MDDKPELTDGNIILRRYCEEDAKPIYQAVRESMAEVSPWMPWCHEGYSLNDSITWSASRDEAWANGEEYNFVILGKNVDQPLGVCGLNHIDNENQIANVGYWVRTTRTRQGVATALMDIAYRDALSHGVKEMWLSASLTAVPFYQKIGWQYLERSMHGELECVKMSISIERNNRD